MNKAMQRAIKNGSPEFKKYAEYVTEAIPDVPLAVLRDMFKHNASVREYQDHMERIKREAHGIGGEA